MPRAPVALASLVAVALVAAAFGAPTRPVHVTLVGDSVSGSIALNPSAQAELSRGLSIHLDAEVCRRLVQPSCAYRGTRPPTAFQAVQSYGRSLGEVLIVHVGYNDSAEGYAQGIDRVLLAARAQGVERVVWVKLHETKRDYQRTNLAIERATQRWPRLVVADWQAHSRKEPWFRRDGIHLNDVGASALAAFLRARVLDISRDGA